MDFAEGSKGEVLRVFPLLERKRLSKVPAHSCGEMIWGFPISNLPGCEE